MRYADDMVAAIQQEIRLRKQDAKKPLKTIYFGGGTPSVLTPAQLQLLIVEVNQCCYANDIPVFQNLTIHNDHNPW